MLHLFALRTSKGAACHDVGMMNIGIREVVGTRIISWGRLAAFTEDDAVCAREPRALLATRIRIASARDHRRGNSRVNAR